MMFRFIAAVVLPIAFASQVLASDMTAIANNSGLPIDELFTAAPGTKDWSKNILEGVPEGALDSGKSVQVATLADGTYDFRVSAPDEGILCYISGVEVRDHKIELTPDHGKACK